MHQKNVYQKLQQKHSTLHRVIYDTTISLLCAAKTMCLPASGAKHQIKVRVIVRIVFARSSSNHSCVTEQ